MEKQLKGFEQWIYLMGRFKMSPSEAIKEMAKLDQDISFLDAYLKEADINLTDMLVALEKIDKIEKEND